MRLPALRLLPALVLFASSSLWAQLPTIAKFTEGLQKRDGFLPLYWDAKKAALFLEINHFEKDLLFYTSLPAGLGSNDVGLDRGQVGGEHLVRFTRQGSKILLQEPNLSYRANSADPLERRAVEESFASSVLWGFSPVAEENDRVLVDATNFFLRDAHDAAGALRQAKAGSYRVDPTRSAFYLERTRSFPKNTEVEVLLTFTGESQGPLVRSVAPSADSITLREHFSFVALPETPYATRAYDPRSSYLAISYLDYATPLGDVMRKRFILRHRLEKKDPSAALSEPVAPIRYYLDPGTPEPVRSALLEGGRWWNQAFEAAGFRNAFQVEMLPPGADAMDIRYNMIHWVHRSTRGWSYGASIIDPRSGEILKGNVTLGSLRMRQDFMIAEGLLAPYESGKPVSEAMRQMALSRLQQLSAHEIGHTLGLMHNFAASVNNRASVMDYPHPLITLEADRLSLREAYTTGIGDWDKVAIRYGYAVPPAGLPEKQFLDKILSDAQQSGLRYLTDSDARPLGSPSPVAHLWDNGKNAVDELLRILQVRRKALDQFGPRNIPEGQPMATLANTLVPIYLLHRYQTEAAAKVLGGVDYNYALRGDGQTIAEPVPGPEQRRALSALLQTVQPEALTLPETLLRQLPPFPPGIEQTRENFKSRTGLTFDPVAAAESAANLSVSLLLHPERLSRLAEQANRGVGNPTAQEVVQALVQNSWRGRPVTLPLQQSVRNAVATTVLYHLMALAANEAAAPEARNAAWQGLRTIENSAVQLDGIAELVKEAIAKFRRDGKAPTLPAPAPAPPGQPIGCAMTDATLQ